MVVLHSVRMEFRFDILQQTDMSVWRWRLLTLFGHMFPNSIIQKIPLRSFWTSQSLTVNTLMELTGKGRAVDGRHRNLNPHTTAICQQIRATLSVF